MALALLFRLAAASCSLAGPDAPIALTSDTEGQVGPCRDCPAAQELGGLPRRAALLFRLRKEDPSLLLIDAGNFLIGVESVASGGRVMVAAYNALGYDAVNLSYRDFRLGKEETLGALRAVSPI
jgi:2',3'-cyclic-nucleotide 2'-phosphodiesterase (5'-nucleotidase family)